MKAHSHFSIIAIIIILVGSSSCASNKLYYRTEKAYLGPERDNSELATIDMGELPSSNSNEEFIILGQVDTINVTAKKLFSRTSPKRCVFLPGKHTFEIMHRKWDNSIIRNINRYLVTFEAEAGKTYSLIVKTDKEKREVNVFVLDTKSKELIGSIVEHKFTLKGKDKLWSQNVSHNQSHYNHKSSSFVIKKGYAGPKQDRSSLARVSETGDVHLFYIDSLFVGKKSNNNIQYEITSGTHTINITHYKKNTFIGNYMVSFVAEAGRTYTIREENDTETSTIDVYVIDETSGERIASTVEHKYKLKPKI